MSQKSGKKARRRTDEEIEAVPKKDIGKIEAVAQKNGSESMDESESINADKECEVNSKEESVASNTRSHSSPLSKRDDTTESNVEDESEVRSDESKIENESTTEAEVKATVVEDVIQDESEKQPEETKTKTDTETELEPLVLESEDPDPELQFDENSDVDSRKGSPIIRCRTRRSLTRNIPTPKTPKSFLDANGEDSEKQTVGVTSELVTVDPVEQGKENSANVSKLCESFESIGNISTKAVAGSDATRNVEFSYSAFQESAECSPFLNDSKDRSVGETLRQLSSRRAIRPVKDYQKLIQQINQEKKKTHKMTLPPALPGRPSVERISGTKRKSHSLTPEFTKRFKPESPGLFSYISSPILSIKNHFSKSDVTSSTPKLTAYKNKTVFDNSDVSQICLDLSPVDNAEKKWCTIM